MSSSFIPPIPIHTHTQSQTLMPACVYYTAQFTLTGLTVKITKHIDENTQSECCNSSKRMSVRGLVQLNMLKFIEHPEYKKDHRAKEKKHTHNTQKMRCLSGGAHTHTHTAQHAYTHTHTRTNEAINRNLLWLILCWLCQWLIFVCTAPISMMIRLYGCILWMLRRTRWRLLCVMWSVCNKTQFPLS